MDIIFEYKDTISVKQNPNKYSTCAAHNVNCIQDTIDTFGFEKDTRVLDWRIKTINNIPYEE